MPEQNIFGGDLPAQPDEKIVAQMQAESEVVDTQWGAYTRARDAGHLDWVKEARKFDEYYYGEQWEDSIKQTLNSQKRPAHTINLVLSTVNAVTGEYIKSRQDISFQPMGKGANSDAARALRFLFKQIALNNRSEQKEKMVFQDGLIQDRGYFYYYLDFSDNLEGEVRELILDPTDVILDPGAKEYDPETWNEVFISRWMTPDEIGAFYGPEYRKKVDLMAVNGTFGHDSIEWEAPTFGGTHYDSEVYYQAQDEDVKRVKRIRVIERQYRRIARTLFFVDPATGDMRRKPEGWDNERSVEFATRMGLQMLWKPERRVRVCVTADKVLLHDDWSLFDNFTIVPFFPYFRRGRPFGLVRNLISPQDMINKVTSQELHVVNTTANSGWMFKSGSLVNMDAHDLENWGAKTGLVLEYSDEAPEKIQPNQIPTGLDQISAKAGVYFREISGVNEAMLGLGRSDSSKALQDRKQGGLIQQEIIFDNLDLTRDLRAKIILEMVQKYYTETRLIQVFEKNEDGDDVQMEVSVNEPVDVVDPETLETAEEIKNDLTIGEYHVVVSSVPRRDTYEEALFDQLIQMREAGVQIPDFVLIEASQLPDKKEVADLIKQLQGMAAPTPEEVERAQVLDDLQMRLLAAEVAEKEAQAMERQANAQKLIAHGEQLASQPEIEQLKIGTDARVQMEKMAAEQQSNTQDLLARLELMRNKNTSAERIAQIGSMTKRTQGGLQRQTEIDKTLLQLQAKEGQRSASKE